MLKPARRGRQGHGGRAWSSMMLCAVPRSPRMKPRPCRQPIGRAHAGGSVRRLSGRSLRPGRRHRMGNGGDADRGAGVGALCRRRLDRRGPMCRSAPGPVKANPVPNSKPPSRTMRATLSPRPRERGLRPGQQRSRRRARRSALFEETRWRRASPGNQPDVLDPATNLAGDDQQEAAGAHEADIVRHRRVRRMQGDAQSREVSA